MLLNQCRIQKFQLNPPVPESENELFPQGEMVFHVSSDQAWQFEVDISSYDIHRWREEDRPHEMAFLVPAAKRQRSEVKLTQLSPEDRERFHQAKLKEVNNWITTETIATIVKITRNKIPRVNVMRCRWILTWKLDIKTAFLRGSEQGNRMLGMEPPKKCARDWTLKQNEIVQLLKRVLTGG